MNDEELRRAFSGAPLGAAILLVTGYTFMFTHADRDGLILFTLGVAMIVLNVLLAEHAIRYDRWWSVPSLLFATLCAFGGAFAVVLSVSPFLS